MGPVKFMANDGALRGRVCCVCLKTALIPDGEVVFSTWNLAFPGMEEVIFGTWNLAFAGGRSNFQYMKHNLPRGVEVNLTTWNLSSPGEEVIFNNDT